MTTRQKRRVTHRAQRLLLFEDEGLEFFIFLELFIRSVLARFSMASSDISRISLRSAASKHGLTGGRGGLGGFWETFFFGSAFFAARATLSSGRAKDASAEAASPSPTATSSSPAAMPLSMSPTAPRSLKPLGSMSQRSPESGGFS